MLPQLQDIEFRCYSQNGEDGILLYLFAMIGTTNRRVVEICAGSGVECNAANLIINHNWSGFLFDGNDALLESGRDFYATHPNTLLSPPQLTHAWIDAETVNDVIAISGASGDIDLLSLDVDGVDYWIWRAIERVAPRVVVVEFNAMFGPHERLTLPYDRNFQLDLSKPGPPKCGASLAAFTALASEKGYRLIGAQSRGFNAFFMKRGLADDLFPELTPQQVYAGTPRLAEYTHSWLEALFEDGQKWHEV